MTAKDYSLLTRYAKHFTGLTPDKGKLLQEAAPEITPRLPEITQRFYNTLQDIAKTPFIEDRLDQLRNPGRRLSELNV